MGIVKYMNLSIIIPVYNVSQYLSITIDNVLSQTYKDFELILVDDGSTDGSGELCDLFASKDSRVHVIHQKNSGVSVARNTGVATAKGRYIGFVDSDDLIEPGMYKVMVDVAEMDKADVVQCRHNRLNSVQNITFSEEKRIIDGGTFVHEMFDYSGGEYTNQVALWSKIYKRELFNYVHFPDGQTYEDEQETYKLCLHADKIVQIPDELYHYVRRENSIITGISGKKMIDKQLSLKDRLTYLPSVIPDLQEKCASIFIGYSKGIMCQLYENNDYKNLDIATKNIHSCMALIKPYLNKYDRLYFFIIKRFPLFKGLIFKNRFSPIQNTLAKVKGIFNS